MLKKSKPGSPKQGSVFLFLEQIHRAPSDPVVPYRVNWDGSALQSKSGR